jgi:hypothetical protein
MSKVGRATHLSKTVVRKVRRGSYVSRAVGVGKRVKETQRSIEDGDALFMIASRIFPKEVKYRDREAFIIACHDIMPGGHPAVNTLDRRTYWTQGRFQIPPARPLRVVPVFRMFAPGDRKIKSTDNQVIEKFEQGLTNWIRQHQPLKDWLRSREAFAAPKEWPEYLWPFFFKYDLRPYHVGCARVAPTSVYNTEKVACLIAWCCGMPVELIADLLDWPDKRVIASMITAARMLSEDYEFVIWAANPDMKLLKKMPKKDLINSDMWDMVRMGGFPQANRSRQLTWRNTIYDQDKRHNEVAFRTGPRFRLRHLKSSRAPEPSQPGGQEPSSGLHREDEGEDV